MTAASAEADAAAGGGADATKQQKKQLSKRQRRKEPNPSNTWPQQPKIQSPAARAKAYLRVAGFGSNKTPQPIDPAVDLHSPELKFGRLLGGTDQRKRHEAVTKLQRYLKARCDIDNVEGGISEMDLLKLWKGMWFTLYMADKVPVQDELSKRLTELIWCVAGTEEEDEYAAQAYMAMCGGEEGLVQEDNMEEDDDDEDVIMEEIVNTLDKDSDDDESSEEEDEDEDGREELERDEELEKNEEEMEDQDDSLVRHCRGAHLASLFVKTFFITVRRDWGKIDKWRVDKFYTLIRLMMQQIYKYMAIRHWNIGIIRLFNDVLFEEVLSQLPNGLRYHLIDIAMEELVNANAKAPMPLTEATFLDCLEPYFAMAQTVQDKLVHARIMDKVLAKFLNEHSVVSHAALEAERNKEEEPPYILDQVHVGSVAQFIFELASDSATQDRYRKDLYAMHKTFMKRLKEVGKDVVLDMDETSDFGAEEEAVGDNIEEGEPAESNIKKSKKKHIETIKSKEPDEAPKKSDKKKKKKRRKRSLEEAQENVEAVETSDPAGTSVSKEPVHAEESVETPEGHKKKKKRKKDKKRKSLEEPEEEVITISVSDQKKAAKAAKDEDTTAVSGGEPKKREKSKKKKSKRSKENDTDEDDSDKKSKRVSFGKSNRSKSYKASMKALKTMDQPSTAKRSPDRGILLKKLENEGVVVKRKPRRKATDYF